MKKRTILLIVLVLIIFKGYSQDISIVEKDNKSYTDLGADIVSSYVWRGQKIDDAPNIQGWGEFGIGNFIIGTWASANFTGTFLETDIYAGYSIGNLNILLTDYFSGSENYFDYTKDTEHSLEFSLDYTISENFPLTITAGTIIAGSDFNVKTYDSMGDEVFSDSNNYSTYLELMYTLTKGDYALDIMVGGTTHESYYYDSTGPAIINTGLVLSKEVQLLENITFPISIALIVNPELESVYTVFKISF